MTLSLCDLDSAAVEAINNVEIAAARGEPSNADLDALALKQDLERRLEALGQMSPVEYARCRDGLAAELDIPVGYLDQEKKAREKTAKKDARPTVSAGWDIDLWPEPVDGADILDQLAITAGAHLKLPKGGADAIALWMLFTHSHDAFQVSPTLAVTSPTPACGKTTLLTFVGGVVPRSLPASNITSAALFRAVEKWQPTVLIDEADTFLRGSDELRGIINSGHARAGAHVIRTTGDDYEPTHFCTWAPKAIAMIGKLPATLASRAVHIELRRKTPGEHIEPLRLGRMDHLELLKRKAAKWASGHMAELRAADPEIPEWLHGRDADNWIPLLAIADIAGGDWPERARRSAAQLTQVKTEQSSGIMLLEDMRRMFEETTSDMITSSDIVAKLIAMEDRPWPEYGRAGKPITTSQLAKLLDPFGIAPGKFRAPGLTPGTRGYERSSFMDAFARYLPDASATPPHSAEILDFHANASATA